MTRGEVWEHTVGGALRRSVIVSTDEYHVDPTARPVGLMIRRDLVATGPWLIALDTGEPGRGGTVVIPISVRIDQTGLRRSLGYLSPRAMAAVEAGLRDFYVLP